MTIKARDHLGNLYPSMRAMAAHYGMSRSTLETRLDKWPLAEALTRPKIGGGAQSCEDHLGNRFPSQHRMALAWGVTWSAFKGRLKNGWSVKDALTAPVKPKRARVPMRDHLGNEYPTMTACAERYGLTMNVLHSRIRRGWSLRRALTTPLIDRRK